MKGLFVSNAKKDYQQLTEKMTQMEFYIFKQDKIRVNRDFNSVLRAYQNLNFIDEFLIYAMDKKQAYVLFKKYDMGEIDLKEIEFLDHILEVITV